MLALVLPFSSMDAVHEYVKAQLILPKKKYSWDSFVNNKAQYMYISHQNN